MKRKLKQRLSILLSTAMLLTILAVPTAAEEFILDEDMEYEYELDYVGNSLLTASTSNATASNASSTSNATGSNASSVSGTVFEVSVGSSVMTFMVLDETEKMVQVGDGISPAIPEASTQLFYIPDSVTYNGETYEVVGIGDYAFYRCDFLTGDLDIPSGVMSIGDYAFYECRQLECLNIPMGVTTIGNRAFGNCSGLTGNLDIPSSVVSIGEYAFANCTGFTGDLIIPYGVTKIEESVFSNCQNFNGTLTIPSSVTSIGRGAFSGCSKLTGNLTIPSSVMSIGSIAFRYCTSFTSLTLLSDISRIEYGTFSGCRGFTGDLVIPSSVTSIGNVAFEGCSGFTGELVIPPDITDIGISAFAFCSGISGTLIIPSGITSIGIHAFIGCYSLEEINVAADNEYFSSEDGILYNKNKSVLIQCPAAKQGELNIIDSVTTISEGAFFYCTELTGELTIPFGVTIIEDCAFEGCSGFTGGLVISSSVTDIGFRAFCDCSGFNGELVIPASVIGIGGGAFQSCKGLDSVKFLGNMPEFLSGICYGGGWGRYYSEPSVFDWGKDGFTLYYPGGNTTWMDFVYEGDSAINICAYNDGFSVSGGGSSAATKNGSIGKWLQDEHGWWYQYSDNSWPKNGWAQLEYNNKSDWYYFDETGYMVTGWVTWEGRSYYMNPVSDGTKGRMIIGWSFIDGNWYYFNEASDGPQGALIRDAMIGEYYVNKDGVWGEVR